MAVEQGLYVQVFKLRRKDFKSIAENKDKNESKLNLQGQSARSQRCFDIDCAWIEVNYSTCEPDLY